MAPTLNTEDINLLKGVFATKDDLKGFATKDDLVAMEKRQDQKYATKNDLGIMEKRMNQKFSSIVKKLNFFFNTLDRHLMHVDRRVTKIERQFNITPAD